MLGKIIKSQIPKTKIVLVKTLTKHPKYNKTIKKTKKYLVHDNKNKHNTGDFVHFIKCAPTSKRKHWVIIDSNSNSN